MTEKKKKVTKAITKAQNNLPVAEWDNAKWEQIKKMFIPKGVSNDDAVMFMELAKAYDLNPFKRELWVVPYGNKAQVFCGRDGFLSIAHKSGQFNGINTEYGYNKQGNLLWAETTVYNKSCEFPIKCKVFLKEYTTGRNLWSTKPHIMLQKVAESSALRRAFNISGLYDPTEFRDEPKGEIKKNPAKQIEQVAEILEAEVVDDNAELQRGNFDVAIKNIESCWDIAKLHRLQKALNKRQWKNEEAQFLIDAVGKQEEKIVAQRIEGEK